MCSILEHFFRTGTADPTHVVFCPVFFAIGLYLFVRAQFFYADSFTPHPSQGFRIGLVWYAKATTIPDAVVARGFCMYVLQRNGDVFEMRHETSETVPGPVVSAPLLWAGGMTGAGRRAAWEAFIRTGEITDNSLPKPIADSWRRCRDMGWTRSCPLVRNLPCRPNWNRRPPCTPNCRSSRTPGLRTGPAQRPAHHRGRSPRPHSAHLRQQRGAAPGGQPPLRPRRGMVGTKRRHQRHQPGPERRYPAQVLGEFLQQITRPGVVRSAHLHALGHLWGCFDIPARPRADHSQALWIAVGALARNRTPAA